MSYQVDTKEATKGVNWVLLIPSVDRKLCEPSCIVFTVACTFERMIFI